jgi:glycosyltransferase involved in cell wall biosynthesis
MTLQGVGYISNYAVGGYRTAAERAVLGLLDAGVPVSWTPLRSHDDARSVMRAQEVRADRRLVEIVDLDVNPDVVVAHTLPRRYPALRSRHPDRPLVGETVWETTRPPESWPPLLDSVDALIVPCRMNEEVLRDAGVTVPIAVVPHLPDPALVERAARADAYGGRDDRFVFYTINTWIERKNVPRTIEAYLRAFEPDDPVVLVVKTSPLDGCRHAPGGGGALAGTTAWSLARLLHERGSVPPVELVAHTLSTPQLRALQLAGDCYVSLTRGEGFGLGAFDAATLGQPVVMTGWGGQLDYLDPSDAHLVEYDLTAIPADLDLPAYTAVAVAAQRDVEAVKRHGNDAVFELPNSVAIPPAVHRVGPERSRRPHVLSLCFVGTFRYPPNVWGAELLVDDVLPRLRDRTSLDVAVALVGRPSPLVLPLGDRAGVRLAGYVADLAPWYEAADVAVAPLTAGGGTRTKIIEACAHRVPVVATSIGAEGLDLEHGEHLLIADTPEAFAEACVAVVEDRDATQHRVERARARVIERYSHDVVEAGLVARYRELLDG